MKSLEERMADKCPEYKEWLDQENKIKKLKDNGVITVEQYAEQSLALQLIFSNNINKIIIK